MRTIAFRGRVDVQTLSAYPQPETNFQIWIGIYMMTSWNGNIFRVTGPLCGEFTVHRPIPLTKASHAWSFDVFFDLCLNKRLSKQSRGWWFETPSGSLWRHCNALAIGCIRYIPWNSPMLCLVLDVPPNLVYLCDTRIHSFFMIASLAIEQWYECSCGN